MKPSDTNSGAPGAAVAPGAPNVARLATLIKAYAPHDGSFELRIPGVHAIRRSRASMELVHGMQQPALCVVAQGAKRLMVGREVYEYDTSHMIAFSVDLPVTAQVTQASHSEPFLCFKLDLDRHKVAELVLKAYPHGLPRVHERSGVSVGRVDTSIVAKAPVRLLVSGMGDALASFFQVDVCYRTGTPSVVTNALSLRAARALARLNLELLLTYGALAKVEAEAGVAGPGLEAVCEANILVSGLSFANGGISACHAIGTAFDHIGELMEVRQFHGEVVAFGTLCQLVMEESKPEVLREIFGFCKSVGLPTTFEEMTLHDLTDEALEKVAGIAAGGGGIKSLPRAHRERDTYGYFYDPRELLAAIKATDAYGRRLGRT